MKTCHICKERKQDTYFHKHDSSPDGRQAACKACCYERSQARKARPVLDINAAFMKWGRP